MSFSRWTLWSLLAWFVYQASRPDSSPLAPKASGPKAPPIWPPPATKMGTRIPKGMGPPMTP